MYICMYISKFAANFIKDIPLVKKNRTDKTQCSDGG